LSRFQEVAVRPITLFGAVVYALIAAAGLFFAAPRAATAGALDDVRARGELRWGGDQESGGPYLFSTPERPDVLTGFEKDLMDEVVRRLGVRGAFTQCAWDKLPDLLRTGGTDVVVNGYELTADHLASKIATVPYFYFQLQLVGRKDDATLRSWADVARPPDGRKKRIGVLAATVAEKWLQANHGGACEIVAYQGIPQALDHVAVGQLDATLPDTPGAAFYRDRAPNLAFVGAPVGEGYYVMYLRPDQEGLKDELDRVLHEVMKDGTLRRIYEPYALWSPVQELLGTPAVDRIAETLRPGGERLRGLGVIAANAPILLRAAGMTVLLAFLAFPLAVALGLLVAIGRTYGPLWLRAPLAVYVEVLRGTPLLLQLYVIFFVLPSVVPLPQALAPYYALVAAVIGLGVNYSAYESEIYRAGLLAVPQGQMEAALAIGLTRRQALRIVVVPQAVRIVIPPVTNDFIALFKDTAVCSVITVVELSKRYSIVANNTGAYLEIAGLTALLYLAMSFPLSLVAKRLERKLPGPNP